MDDSTKANGLPTDNIAGGTNTFLARLSQSAREAESPYWRQALSRMSERTGNGSDASALSAGEKRTAQQSQADSGIYGICLVDSSQMCDKCALLQLSGYMLHCLAGAL